MAQHGLGSAVIPLFKKKGKLFLYAWSLKTFALASRKAALPAHLLELGLLVSHLQMP